MSRAKTKPEAVQEAPAAPVAPERDPGDMTVNELLAALIRRGGVGANDPEEWINIRDDRYPWRHVVDAADRGECRIAPVGRRLMMQRKEYSRWLSTRCKAPLSSKEEKAHPTNEADELQRQVRASLERSGYRRP